MLTLTFDQDYDISVDIVNCLQAGGFTTLANIVKEAKKDEIYKHTEHCQCDNPCTRGL